MDHNEDTEFGRYLLAQANSLETPLGKAADAYAQGVIERITKAIANGDLDNTLQGDLELMKAEFLDTVQPGQSQGQDGVFTKMDEDKRLVWGWANVSTLFGDTVVDKQNDTIDMDELQKAAHSFMSDRTSGQMHKYIGKDPHKIGEIVESMIFDNDLQKALGINLGREGWLIGVKVSDEDTWQRIKKGELKAFSIGGKGVRKEDTEVDKAWSEAARAASIAARAASKHAEKKPTPENHDAAEVAHRTAADMYNKGIRQGNSSKSEIARDDHDDEAYYHNLQAQSLRRKLGKSDVSKAWSDAAREASARARAASKEANAQVKGTGKHSDKHLEAALAHHDAAMAHNKETGAREGSWGPGADPFYRHADARDKHLDKANPYNNKEESHKRYAWYEGAQPDRVPGFSTSKADTIGDLKYLGRIKPADFDRADEAGEAYDEGKAARRALRSGSGYIGKAWGPKAWEASIAARREDGATAPASGKGKAAKEYETYATRANQYSDRAHKTDEDADHFTASLAHGNAASAAYYAGLNDKVEHHEKVGGEHASRGDDSTKFGKAWSDEARAAALEARKLKAGGANKEEGRKLADAASRTANEMNTARAHAVAHATHNAVMNQHYDDLSPADIDHHIGMVTHHSMAGEWAAGSEENPKAEHASEQAWGATDKVSGLNGKIARGKSSKDHRAAANAHEKAARMHRQSGNDDQASVHERYSNKHALRARALKNIGKFADPDNALYPINKEEEIRASWNDLMRLTTPPDEFITKRVIAEWQHIIDPQGPPGLAKKLVELSKAWTDAAREASARARAAGAKAEKASLEAEQAPSAASHLRALKLHQTAATAYNAVDNGQMANAHQLRSNQHNTAREKFLNTFDGKEGPQGIPHIDEDKGKALMTHIKSKMAEIGLGRPDNGMSGAEVTGKTQSYGSTGYSVRDEGDGKLNYHVVVDGKKAGIRYNHRTEDSSDGEMNVHEPIDADKHHAKIKTLFEGMGHKVHSVSTSGYQMHWDHDVDYNITTDNPFKHK